MLKIIDDTRRIKAIYTDDGQSSFVKGHNCDSIEPYKENEELWFAIVEGAEIIRRVNGKYVTLIIYIKKEA